MSIDNGDDSTARKLKSDEGNIVSLANLHAFKYRRDSLRLSAHRISALTGYHPYADLPRVLFDLVYQGQLGRALLRSDADILGLDIRSDEEILSDLATKGGKETQRILQEARKVKTGRRVVGTATEAAGIKSNAASAATAASLQGKLTKEEVQQLEEGIRFSIDTGFGTMHEEEALDKYEKLCGWKVRERNSEVREWEFARAEDCCLSLESDLDTHGDDESSHVVSPTVRPTGPASSIYKKSEEGSSRASSGSIAPIDTDDVNTRDMTKTIAHSESTNIIKGAHNEKTLVTEAATHFDSESIQIETGPRSKSSGKDNDILVMHSKDTAHKKKGRKRKRPFFSIRGAVDGIRDEVYFEHCQHNQTSQSAQVGDFDDGMTVREVIVECKHRMKRALDPPPLYDQIQAVAYCFMYDTDVAEIVQVVRKRIPRRPGEDSVTKCVANGKVSNIMPSKPMNEKKGCSKDGERNKESGSECILQHFGRGKEAAMKSKSASENKTHMTTSSRPENNNSDLTRDDAVKVAPQNTKPACGNGGAVEKQDISVCEDKQNNSLLAGTKRKDALDTGACGPAKHGTVERTDIKITVSRLCLDDPCMSHRQNWHNIILPRLRSFVDAAYNVRADDGLRYRLLMSLSGAPQRNSCDDTLGEENDKTSWRMLFEQCPWVVDCDTPYHFRWGRPHLGSTK
mmetsp:Transcript_47300/g.143236  ORF Transcript_47300/g.143236 Transcript_47300/m.143236 type:complete len:683 (-) Transcript_47300:470-2518(-)